MKTTPNLLPEPQPNVFGEKSASAFPFGFWVLIVLTGVGAGLGGAALMGLLRLTQHLAWSYRTGDFLDAVSRTSPWHRIAVLAMAGGLVAVARYALKRPPGGHGGEVSAAVWFRSGELPVVRTLAGAVVSIVTVGLGAALGREGAPKQVGAVIGNLLATRAKTSSSQRRLLAACGAGAGLAAVYNVPFGGALFTMEILLGTISLSIALPALATSFISVSVALLFLPNQPTYSVPEYPFAPSTLAGAGLLGVMAGILSTFYLKWVAWADRREPGGPWRAVAPLLVFTVLGIASVLYPELLGNGKNITQLAFLGQVGMPLLLILLFLRPLATGACLASGALGGLFTPTLAFGALLGGLFGHVWYIFFPDEPAAVYAILGAGTALAAGMKAPFSGLVLLFELTHHLGPLLLPLMLAIAIATGIAARFDPRSIYSARLHLGKTMALYQQERPLPEGVIFRRESVISSATPYPEVLKRWLKLPPEERLLYVIDEEGVLVGKIDSDRLMHAEEFASPLEAASADDLLAPTKALAASLSVAEMRQELAAERTGQLPVTDDGMGRFLGVFRDS